MKYLLLSCVAFVLGPTLFAQGAPPNASPRPPSTFLSPEVHADKRVTFRVAAPGAKLVELDGSLPLKRTPMEKGQDGLWTVTVGPIAPGLYHYWIRVDGLGMADAMNPLTKPAIFPKKSLLEVPGDTPQIHEFQNVPHGVVRMHYYRSKVFGKQRAPARLHAAGLP